jgi:hypothetical protein
MADLFEDNIQHLQETSDTLKKERRVQRAHSRKNPNPKKRIVEPKETEPAKKKVIIKPKKIKFED